jgi:hypothetical protein
MFKKLKFHKIMKLANKRNKNKIKNKLQPINYKNQIIQTYQIKIYLKNLDNKNRMIINKYYIKKNQEYKNVSYHKYSYKLILIKIIK